MSGPRDLRAWYSVMILNNRSDPGFAAGTDQDHSVIIYVAGYGPQGSVASLAWEVSADPSGAPRPFTLVGWRRVL